MRIVIYTHYGKTIKFDNVKNINFKSDTLYFELEGYIGDDGKSMFRDIAGYTTYENPEMISK